MLTEASAVPLHGMKEMLREMMQAQGEIAQKQIEAQSSILERIIPQLESDPLQKLRGKDPQFPAFTEKSEHLLAWIVERRTRKEQRDLRLCQDGARRVHSGNVSPGHTVR